MTVVNDLSHLSPTDFDTSDYAVPTVAPIRYSESPAPSLQQVDAMFCIHPLVGLTDCYAPLTAHLDDVRPIYGVQVSATGDRAESLTALASRYADDIVRVRPLRAVHLLGLSFGGVLAHAIAVELQRRGVDIGGLTLLDSNPVSAGSDHADLLGAIGANVDRSHVEELLAAALHNHRLAQHHLPGIYHGDMLAVSSDGHDSGSAWHPFVRGTVTKYLVPDATSFDIVGPLVNGYFR